MNLPSRNLLLTLSISLGMLFTFAGQAKAHPFSSIHSKYRTHFMIYDVHTKTAVPLFTVEGEWHAPNWTPDGKYLVSDSNGMLYRIPVTGENRGKPEKIYDNANVIITNDHAVSWDGRQIAVSGMAWPFSSKMGSPAGIHNGILVMNIDGSAAHEVGRGWLHGWSPDSAKLVFTEPTAGSPAMNIYRFDVDGKGQAQLTSFKKLDDGPEFSADGKWVYFCSNRSGKWDAWRMPADGAGQNDKLAEKITSSVDTQDWFPHVSADGKWLYTISYPKDHPDHSYIGEGMKIRLLHLKGGVGAKGAELTTIRTFFGGQGAGNTSGWARDSKAFVWTEYEATPNAAN